MFSCSGLQKVSIKIKMVTTINMANNEFMKNIGYEIVGTGGGKVLKPTSVPSLPQGQHSSSWTACHPSCSSATRSTPGIRLKLEHLREESASVCQCKPKRFSHLIPSPAELIVVLALVLKVLQPVLGHSHWITKLCKTLTIPQQQ